jgi:hypothetical protein
LAQNKIAHVFHTVQIEVKTPDDIRAAYEFSERTKVPLSIKNTGHDIMGRSRRRDSLALWVRFIFFRAFSRLFELQDASSTIGELSSGHVALAILFMLKNYR